MVRSKFLALSLVSLCCMQMAEANLVKDAQRIVVGSAAGAAGIAALNVVVSSIKTFVTLGELSKGQVDYQSMRLFGLIGGTIGLATTTYGRTLRAQWNLWEWSSKKLIAITMAEYASDAELVSAVEQYYLTATYPLVAAKFELTNKLDYLNDAALLIEAALEDIDEDSSRADDLEEWLDKVYTMRAHVAHAVMVIEKDPRLMTLIDAQNRVNQTNALWFDALGHIAVAAANASNKK